MREWHHMLLRVKSLINKIMKHIFTISLCFLALSLSAQEDCPNLLESGDYVFSSEFPYNPDGNSDGMVTLPDLLDLLALYGSEYGEGAFITDSSRVALYLGKQWRHDCERLRRNLVGSWRLLTIDDLFHFEEIVAILRNEAIENNTTAYVWIGPTENPDRYIYFNDNGSCYYHTSHNTGAAMIIPPMNIEPYPENHCWVVAEAYPEIEYKCIESTNYESASQELINQGYIPFGGPSNSSGNYPSYFGCFWRWAE